jgi:hypothetical protein
MGDQRPERRAAAKFETRCKDDETKELDKLFVGSSSWVVMFCPFTKSVVLVSSRMCVRVAGGTADVASLPS